ncbi:hypothetical protein SPONN_2363 [uncultured Candidatus Thioglobus sp.]|nr:hypothetical protein SPONN_2363 [uncultured Candidatus Thioglobus sp.]
MLLKEFCTKGIPEENLLDLTQLVSTNAPSLLLLLTYVKGHIDTRRPILVCPSQWSPLLSALASPSPVCGLVRPSEQLFHILQRLRTEDITKDVESMKILQTEIPVIFELLRCVTYNYLPTKSLIPVIEQMMEKSMAPFVSSEPEVKKANTISKGSDESVLSELAYFPSLPKVRVRGVYSVDKHSRKAVGCTKQSSGHPTLLPGIFTLYCPHGEFTMNTTCSMLFNCSVLPRRNLLRIPCYAST